MAGKAGGRLTFSGRQEYEVAPVYGMVEDRGGGFGPGRGTIGYAAICTCPLGNHYLAADGDVESGDFTIVERTVTPDTKPYIFPYRSGAEAAIRIWQRQHAEAQANSGESEG